MKIKYFFITITISLLIGFLSGITAGLIAGVKLNKQNNSEQIISSIVVLDKIKDQSFLVTRTIITEQKVEIIIDQGSAWSNFWWGHEITAESLIQVDVGVDLSKITKEDIEVNNTDKLIIVKLPNSEIYDSSLKGEINVSTNSGILKKLLATDDNEDYNLALTELTSNAKEAVEQNEELLEEAKTSTLSILQAIFQDTGYTIAEFK